MSQVPGAAPHLERRRAATQMIVDGKPFLMLGGELHNSSSSSLEYMKAIWPRLAAVPMNTVLTPVSWELVEPMEGRYDFALVDGLLAQAKEQHLHVVLLWLAAWKNGMSSYDPVWVKEDTKRFPRAVLHGSEAPVLSTLEGVANGTRDADARAFAALLQHLKEVDARDHTVLMMQVENEVGVLGATRDHSAAAERAFAGRVPGELMRWLKGHREALNPELKELWVAHGEQMGGTWGEVFGESARADEIFMAWNYARYVQAVAAAGKAAYPLPMYVNTWLGGGDTTPGDYPSGGPQPRVMDIWKAAATALDLYAPDLYAADFAGWAKRYHRADNPLFLPETNGGENGAGNVFLAVGEHAAMGFSPFAIDAGFAPTTGHATEAQRAAMERGMTELGASYAALEAAAPMVLQAQSEGMVHGFTLTREHPSVEFNMAEYTVQVSLDDIFGNRAERGYGLVMMTGREEFTGVGMGFRVLMTPRDPAKHAGIASVVEGKMMEGAWVPGRRLNGDENDQGNFWRFDSQAVRTEKATLYRYE